MPWRRSCGREDDYEAHVVTPAEEVLDFFKRHYEPHQHRCHQSMAIIQAGRIESRRAEQGIEELHRRCLVEPRGVGGWCLTDAGVQAIGAAPKAP